MTISTEILEQTSGQTARDSSGQWTTQSDLKFNHDKNINNGNVRHTRNNTTRERNIDVTRYKHGKARHNVRYQVYMRNITSTTKYTLNTHDRLDQRLQQ